MKNYWAISWIVSLSVHTLIFTGVPDFSKHNPPPVQETKLTPINTEIIKNIKVSKSEKRVELNQPKPLPFVDRIIRKTVDTQQLLDLNKSNFLKKTQKTTTISKSPTDPNLKENPAYMDYYRALREKIRANVFSNYDRKIDGKIALRFQISKEGKLKDITIGSDSSSSLALRKIVLKSVRAASPFPVFPKELKDYTAIEFKIDISFSEGTL